MSDNDYYDYLFKVVLIGDSAVGKSSLLKQLTEKSFIPDMRTTVGKFIVLARACGVPFYIIVILSAVEAVLLPFTPPNF